VAHPQIAVFARLADGQAERVRAIEGQRTLLGRTMHGIAYDPVHDEIYVTQQFGQAILVFRGAADGEEPPVRVIQGSKTQLSSPDTLTFDSVNGDIYVPDAGKILVYPRTANGNVAPARVVRTAGSELGGVVIDPVRNFLIAGAKDYEGKPTGTGNAEADKKLRESLPPSGRLHIYPRTANGNIKPLRVISGLRGGRMAMHPPSGLVFIMQQQRSVGVWHVDDEQLGREPARFTIGAGSFGRGMGLALDPRNDAVIVSDKDMNAVLTFHVPEVFSPDSSAEEARR
jgi:hypothetical protein